MIQSQEEFDAVLEEATHLLETDPADGSPHARRLSDLMGMLTSYSTLLQAAPADDAAAEERAELIARANELERKFHATSGPHVYTDLHPGAA